MWIYRGASGRSLNLYISADRKDEMDDLVLSIDLSRGFTMSQISYDNTRQWRLINVLAAFKVQLTETIALFMREQIKLLSI